MIRFITVKDNAIKMQKLVFHVLEHYRAGKSILILAPNKEAADYIDALFWRIPENSFHPHVIAEDPTDEKFTITTQRTNINNAKIIVNLTSDPYDSWHKVDELIELLDETLPARRAAALKKMEFYRAHNINFSQE